MEKEQVERLIGLFKNFEPNEIQCLLISLRSYQLSAIQDYFILENEESYEDVNNLEALANMIYAHNWFQKAINAL